MSEVEIWKPVLAVGYEGLYECSNLGVVKRVVRANGTSLLPLKQNPNRGGYLQVTLSNKCVARKFLVSNLVCIAFHGPRPPNHDVDHRDFDLSNNRAENLRWRHMTLNRGEARSPRGADCPWSTLNEAAVLEIRAADFSVYGTLSALANKFGVWPKTIAQVRDGKSWRHV